MENSLQSLIQIGFEEVGHWYLYNDGIGFILHKHKQARDCLYAFTCEDSVLYIGKTTKTLFQRMVGYSNPGPSQKTNIRNHQLIKETFQRGPIVDIFAFVPEETMSYRGFQVNIAAGLEDSLIAYFKPPWNNLK